jgi:hypothetical protein
MNSSQLDLTPKDFEFGPNPVDPVAVPGRTPSFSEPRFSPNGPRGGLPLLA